MTDTFKQFVLTHQPHQRIDGWKVARPFGLYLSTVASLPLVELRHCGKLLAFVLGWMVFRNELISRRQIYSLESCGGDLDWFVERLCGRFVLIRINESNLVEVSSDAGGMFPVVYDVEHSIAGSSPYVISKFRDLTKDAHVLEGVRRRDSSVWFPFGITPYKSIRRLIPSQVLVVGNNGIRVANKKFIEVNEGRGPDAKALCEMVGSNISAFAAGEPIWSHLTAGFDSRMVLAAALKVGVKLRYSTISAREGRKSIDVHVAKRLANRLNLDHETISYLEPGKEQLVEWQIRVGECINDEVMNLCRTVEQNDEGFITLTGSGGEVCRSFYWVKGDIGSIGLDASDLLVRMGFENSRLLCDEAEKWLCRFPAGSRTTYILDNAYIDQRLACWAGPSMPGHFIPVPTISPFNSRIIYRSMLSLDDEYRFSQDFALDFIRSGSASLLGEGFNQASGMNRLFFWESEVKRILPKQLKSVIRKSLRV